jgi:hypothetical protein
VIPLDEWREPANINVIVEQIHPFAINDAQVLLCGPADDTAS